MENLDFTQFRPIGEIICDLKKPVARRHLRERTQGGKLIFYLSWSTACKYMDLYANGWFSEIRKTEVIGGKLVMTVRVSIPAKEGLIWREDCGSEDEDKDNYGDAATNAAAQAMKRAFAKFGLGQYLYELTRDDEEALKRGGNIDLKIPAPVTPFSQTKQPEAAPSANIAIAAKMQEPGKPLAPVSDDDLPPTDAQLEALNDWRIRLQMSEVEVVSKYTNGQTDTFDTLNRKDADALIDWFKKVAAHRAEKEVREIAGKGKTAKK